MNHLEPSWLQSFVAIAELGALTRAATRVGRTPSAISVQLQQLEAAVAARLVERTTRRMHLTDAGERFLPFARRVLAAQQEAIAAVRPVHSTETWRIGLSEYFLPSRLDALLGLLEEMANGARLEVLWARSAEVEARWSRAQLDLAVLTAPTPPRDAVVVRRETLSWVAAPSFRVPTEGPLPLVLLADTCPVRTMALAALERRRIPSTIRLACGGSQAIVTALRAGWGVGCLNASAIPPDLEGLAKRDPRRWSSPGRLVFYALARPALAQVARRLAAWAG